MKFIALLIMLVVIGLASQTVAAPFLTCDCYTAAQNVQQFRVKINSGAYVNTPPVGSCGTVNPNVCAAGGVTMCYDLAGLPAGTNTIVSAAQDIWGWSTDSPPFTLARPAGGIGSPSTLRYIIQ